MNTQTIILISAGLFIVGLILSFYLNNKNISNKKKLLISYFTIVLVIIVSLVYIPKLPSVLGGGQLHKSSYSNNNTSNVVPPVIISKDVINYKEDGKKALDSALQ